MEVVQNALNDNSAFMTIKYASWSRLMLEDVFDLEFGVLGNPSPPTPIPVHVTQYF